MSPDNTLLWWEGEKRRQGHQKERSERPLKLIRKAQVKRLRYLLYQQQQELSEQETATESGLDEASDSDQNQPLPEKSGGRTSSGRWYCAICGQVWGVPGIEGEPPLVCDFCNDATTWRPLDDKPHNHSDHSEDKPDKDT
jgi:hypothetical protein